VTGTSLLRRAPAGAIVIALVAQAALAVPATAARRVAPPPVVTVTPLPLAAARELNDTGVVVGATETPAGDTFRAASWRDGVLTFLLPDESSSSSATSVNDRGQILGADEPAGNFLWNRGRITHLPGGALRPRRLNDRGQVLLSGPDGGLLLDPRRGTSTPIRPPSAGLVQVDALSDRGDVTGAYSPTVVPIDVHCFVYHEGTYTDLGLTVPCGIHTAINRAGQIVGDTDPTGPPADHAFLWDHGVLTDLGTLGGAQSFALDINDRGQIAGEADTAAGERHAFLWRDGVMTDLGTLGGTSSEARALNDRGQVAGVSTTSDGGRHAFLWNRGVMTDLGPIGSFPGEVFDLNNRGQVLGAPDDGSGLPPPVLWTVR
jgi:probable HAF family extracellular repeat protein